MFLVYLNIYKTAQTFINSGSAQKKNVVIFQCHSGAIFLSNAFILSFYNISLVWTARLVTVWQYDRCGKIYACMCSPTVRSVKSGLTKAIKTYFDLFTFLQVYLTVKFEIFTKNNN